MISFGRFTYSLRSKLERRYGERCIALGEGGQIIMGAVEKSKTEHGLADRIVLHC